MAGEVTIGKGVIPIRADTSQLTKELGSLQSSVGRAINGAAGKIAAPFARAGKSVAATAKLFAGIPKTVVDSYAFTGKLAGAKLAAGFTRSATSPIGRAAIGMAAKFSVGAVNAAAKVDTAFAGVGLKIASRLSPFNRAIAASAVGASKIYERTFGRKSALTPASAVPTGRQRDARGRFVSGPGGLIPSRAPKDGGGGGISRLSHGLKEAAQAITRLTGRGAVGAVSGLSGAVTGLGQSFTGMAGAANSAITGIGAAITSGLSFSISGIGNAIAGVVTTIGNAVSSVATIVGDLVSAATKAFGGLVAAATSLLPNIGEVLATAVSGVTNLIAVSVQAAASAISGLVSVVTNAISTAIKTVASLVEAAASALGRMLQAVADTALKVGGIVAAAGAAMGFGIYKAVYAASDLAETVQKVGVVFGKSTSTVTKAAAEMAKSLGIPKREFLDAASSIGLIAKAAGLAQGASANLSVKLAKLGADAASFYNVPLEDALGAMKSGLVGEAEPLRRFGVLLNEDAVKAEALSLGIVRNTKAMTEGQKVQARASLIIKGMTDASGDLARTQDSLANRTRELGGRFHTLLETIGGPFLPAAEAIAGSLSKLTGQITEWVEENSSKFKWFADMLESAGNAIGNTFSKWTTYVDLARSIFDDIAAAAKVAFSGLGEILSTALKSVIPALKSFAGPLKGLANYILDLFDQVSMAIKDRLTNAMADAVVAMAGPLHLLLQGDIVLKAINSKVVPHKIKPKPIGDFVKGDEIADSADKFGAALKSAFGEAVTGVANFFGKLDFSSKTKALAKEVATPEEPQKPPKAPTLTAKERLNDQNQKRGLISGPTPDAMAKIGSGVYDPLGGYKADQIGLAKAMMAPGGGMAHANFLAQKLSKSGTKKEQAQHSMAAITPGIAGIAAQTMQIAQQLMPQGVFKGTEAQAEKILRTRARNEAAKEAKERRENARKVARGQRVEANRLARLTPKERAAEAEAKEEKRIAREKEQKKPGFVGPPALDGIAKPGAGATLQTKQEAFKSEFIGLEDFAKKIQTNILSGGEDDAKKTARNTELTYKAVEKLASRGGAAPVAVVGP